MMFLLDVNVWLALAFERHRHHESAASWFAAAADNSCCFCRLTQITFLRLSTTPQVMQDDALTLAESWQVYDQLFHDPRVVFAEEPLDMEAGWRRFTQHKTYSPKVWNDAYLAAFASAAAFQLVTFVRGFAQYPNLNHVRLS